MTIIKKTVYEIWHRGRTPAHDPKEWEKCCQEPSEEDALGSCRRLSKINKDTSYEIRKVVTEEKASDLPESIHGYPIKPTPLGVKVGCQLISIATLRTAIDECEQLAAEEKDDRPHRNRFKVVYNPWKYPQNVKDYNSPLGCNFGVAYHPKNGFESKEHAEKWLENSHRWNTRHLYAVMPYYCEEVPDPVRWRVEYINSNGTWGPSRNFDGYGGMPVAENAEFATKELAEQGLKILLRGRFMKCAESDYRIVPVMD